MFFYISSKRQVRGLRGRRPVLRSPGDKSHLCEHLVDATVLEVELVLDGLVAYVEHAGQEVALLGEAVVHGDPSVPVDALLEESGGDHLIELLGDCSPVLDVVVDVCGPDDLAVLGAHEDRIQMSLGDNTVRIVFHTPLNVITQI